MNQLPVMKSETFKNAENQSVAMAFIQVYKRLNDTGKKNLINYVEDCSLCRFYQLDYDRSVDDKEERILKANIILERIKEQRANKLRQENVDNYKEVFDILEYQPTEAMFTDEVKAIRDKYLLDGKMPFFVRNLFHWGYIQGKRAERARRKAKISN